ncbi:paraneoplastic antigen Ma1 homolog [Mauremys mutica]|uniref:paraneoplastic antigen Ma1 homolog n=1 Tax=Mauremys mutica TaxID=74926 RepID=UPI001D16234D|nr:paraneoplastic antigen Ma1 homolog [Mauremys mutica]
MDYQKRLVTWCELEGADPERHFLLTNVPTEWDIRKIEEEIANVREWGTCVVRSQMQAKGEATLSLLVESKIILSTVVTPHVILPDGEKDGWKVTIQAQSHFPSPPAPPSEPINFQSKLRDFLRQEGKTMSDLRTLLGSSPVPPSSSTDQIIFAMGQAIGESIKTAYESGPYRKLKYFSGIKPVPVGEDDYDTWRHQLNQVMQEWQCSEAEKRKRVAESLRGPAGNVICALKASKPVATVDDYLSAMEDAFGSLETGEDLYFQFRSCYQQPGEKLSSYLHRLEPSLQLCIRRKGIERSKEHRVRLEQVIRGAIYDDFLIMKLKLVDRLDSPPEFHQLLREVREEEEKRTVRERNKISVSRTVAPNQLKEDPCLSTTEDLHQQLKTLTAQLTELMTSKMPRGSLSEILPPTLMARKCPPFRPGRGDPNREPVKKTLATLPRNKRFCYRCGEDGHISTQCDNSRNEEKVAQRKRELQGNSQGSQ